VVTDASKADFARCVAEYIHKKIIIELYLVGQNCFALLIQSLQWEYIIIYEKNHIFASLVFAGPASRA
jgi:hypothetical protein